jgi:hypothetical protein
VNLIQLNRHDPRRSTVSIVKNSGKCTISLGQLNAALWDSARLGSSRCSVNETRCAVCCLAPRLNYLTRPSHHLYIPPFCQPSKCPEILALECKRFFGTVSASKAVKLATLTKQHSQDTDLSVSSIQLRCAVPPTRTLRIKHATINNQPGSDVLFPACMMTCVCFCLMC